DADGAVAGELEVVLEGERVDRLAVGVPHDEDAAGYFVQRISYALQRRVVRLVDGRASRWEQIRRQQRHGRLRSLFFDAERAALFVRREQLLQRGTARRWSGGRRRKIVETHFGELGLHRRRLACETGVPGRERD